METFLQETLIPAPGLEAGGQRAERQWRQRALHSIVLYDSLKPEGREPKGNGDVPLVTSPVVNT